MRLSLKPGLGFTLTIVALSISTACSDDTERIGRDLDAGTLFDAANATVPTPDLRFKWVGAGESFTLAGNTFYAPFAPPHDSPTLGFNGSQGVAPLGLWFGFDQQDAGVLSTGSSLADGGSLFANLPAWSVCNYLLTPVSAPLQWTVQSGPRAGLETAAGALFKDGKLVSSLDVWDGVYGLTAVGAPDATAPITAIIVQRLPADMLSTWAASEGQAGRVITAISGDNDQLVIVSYGRDADQRSFDTETVSTDFAQLETSARALAIAGYTITAVGRQDSTLLLVGTKQTGTLEPHTITSVSRPRFSANGPTIAPGFAIVAWVIEDTQLIIYER